MIRHVERINGSFIFPQDESNDYGYHPQYPDYILNLVSPSLFSWGWIAHSYTFLKSACRTEISAPYSSQKHRKNEHRSKYYKTSIHYMVGSSLNDKVWRKIPYGNRKEQKRNNQYGFSNPLSHHKNSLCIL